MAHIRGSFKMTDLLNGLSPVSGEEKTRLIQAGLKLGFFGCYNPKLRNAREPAVAHVQCSNSDAQLGIIFDLTGYPKLDFAKRFGRMEKLTFLSKENIHQARDALLRLGEQRQAAETKDAKQQRQRDRSIRKAM